MNALKLEIETKIIHNFHSRVLHYFKTLSCGVGKQRAGRERIANFQTLDRTELTERRWPHDLLPCLDLQLLQNIKHQLRGFIKGFVVTAL